EIDAEKLPKLARRGGFDPSLLGGGLGRYSGAQIDARGRRAARCVADRIGKGASYSRCPGGDMAERRTRFFDRAPLCQPALSEPATDIFDYIPWPRVR